MSNQLRLVLICLGTILLAISPVWCQDKPQQEAKTIVVATGVGLDPGNALLNALSNAVEQAIGVVVDAETLVKNESIVNEKILTYSNGYVEKYKSIKEQKRADGLYEVKIKALIKRGQLIQKLKEVNITTTKVEGESLFAETVTQVKAEKTAAKLLESAMEGLPTSLLIAEVVDKKPKILSKSTEGAKVAWTIRIKYNQKDYYEKVMPKLQKMFEAIANKKLGSSITKAQQIQLPKRGGIDDNKNVPLIWGPQASTSKEIEMKEDDCAIYLITRRSGKGDSVSMEKYLVDKNACFPILKAIAQREPKLHLVLLDTQKQVVREDELFLKEYLTNMGLQNRECSALADRRGGNCNFPNFLNLVMLPTTTTKLAMCSISPFFKYAYYYANTSLYFDTFEIPWEIDISLDEMKKVSEIQCSFVE